MQLQRVNNIMIWISQKDKRLRMGVQVVHERELQGFSEKPYECCCMCDRPTPYWHTKNDVALCCECALSVEEKDVPTKEEWFDSYDKNNRELSLSRC